MKQITAAPSARTGAKITTQKIAALFGVEPHTPRASLCRNGHWLNLRPVKLPNGRLLWDEDEATRVLNGEVA